MPRETPTRDREPTNRRAGLSVGGATRGIVRGLVYRVLSGLCFVALASSAFRCASSGGEGIDSDLDARGGIDRRRADGDAWVRSDSGDSQLKLNPLCGAVGACYPDLEQGCGVTLHVGAGGTPWLFDAAVGSPGDANAADASDAQESGAGGLGSHQDDASNGAGGATSTGAGGASGAFFDAGALDVAANGGSGSVLRDAQGDPVDSSRDWLDAARFDEHHVDATEVISDGATHPSSDASYEASAADAPRDGGIGAAGAIPFESGGSAPGASGGNPAAGLGGSIGTGGPPTAGDSPPGASDPSGTAGTLAGGSIADAAVDAPPPQACYLRTVSSTIHRSCETAGNRLDEEACDDSSDCGPGRACVEITDPDAGHRVVCRTLACTVPANCPNTSTFYDELPLHEAGKTLSVLVPVCSPADGCKLLEDSCSERHACAVVGDGVTTCLPVGAAVRDQPCSNDVRCAPGLVCAKTTSRCMKLCHVDTNECGEGVCQGRTLALPTGFGVCIEGT